MKIAILTSKNEYGKNEDDLLIIKRLNNTDGVLCHHCIWNNPEIEWKEYDKIVIRTPWDYSQNYEEFFSFINKSTIKEKLINSIDVINWNINKTYLKRLKLSGVQVIETRFLSDWKYESILESINILGNGRAILKPSISAGGRAVYLLEDNTYLDDIFKIIPKVGELMIQPFKEEILDGEFSAIIINNRLYHTVIKTPPKNGFKVQSHYGGTEKLFTTDPYNEEFCMNIVNILEYPIHYGRIDYIVEKGTPKLMELELFEPDLFLRECKDALNQFCQMILNSLRS